MAALVPHRWRIAFALVFIVCALSGCAGPRINRAPVARATGAAVNAPGQIIEASMTAAGLPRANVQAAELALPSDRRIWQPEMAMAPYAHFRGDEVTIYNIRNNQYRTDTDFDVIYETRTYDLRTVQSIDFVVVPFPKVTALAHTMISFGFADGRYLCLSVEIRKELGEKYSAAGGLARQFEIMYVLGDERDLFGLRTIYQGYDVYVYRTKATPEQSRAIFVDVLNRANKLAGQPEFYHTLANNCTTNIANHINRLTPGRIPYDVRVMLPGLADSYAYDLGLIDSNVSFEETKRKAWINARAIHYASHPQFSQMIRLAQ